MKKIGIIGGTSWQSTIDYYRIINEEVAKRLGGLSSARLVLYSLNFDELAVAMGQGRWDFVTDRLIETARHLEKSKVDCILIATNSMHHVFDEVQNATQLPLLHIADAVGEKIKLDNHQKVGLLGTKTTMEFDFYKARLRQNYNIDVIVPNPDDRQYIHNTIFERLCCGKFLDEDRQAFLNLINDLKTQGAEAVILGCTEIPVLLKNVPISLPIYDTTYLHSMQAVDFSLE